MTWHCSVGMCCMQYITQVEDFSSIIVPTRANAESLGTPLGKWKKCSELQGEKLFFPLLFSSGLKLITVSPKGCWPQHSLVTGLLNWEGPDTCSGLRPNTLVSKWKCGDVSLSCSWLGVITVNKVNKDASIPVKDKFVVSISLPSLSSLKRSRVVLCCETDSVGFSWEFNMVK